MEVYSLNSIRNLGLIHQLLFCCSAVPNQWVPYVQDGSISSCQHICIQTGREKGTRGRKTWPLLLRAWSSRGTGYFCSCPELFPMACKRGLTVSSSAVCVCPVRRQPLLLRKGEGDYLEASGSRPQTQKENWWL